VVCVAAEVSGRVALIAALALSRCVRDNRRLLRFAVSVVLDHDGSFRKMGIKIARFTG
jgi:hypothetical protein